MLGMKSLRYLCRMEHITDNVTDVSEDRVWNSLSSAWLM